MKSHNYLILLIALSGVLVFSIGPLPQSALASPANPSSLEKISEWFGDLFTLGDVAKMERNLKKADTIFQDIEKNLDTSPEEKKEAWERYTHRVEKAKYYLGKAESKQKIKRHHAERFYEIIQRHHEILRNYELREEQKRVGLDRVLEVVKETNERAHEVLEITKDREESRESHPFGERPSHRDTPSTGELVVIDFSIDQGPVTYRASGFLDIKAAPRELVTPLKPQLNTWVAWLRPGWKDHYQRAQELGAVVQTKLGADSIMIEKFGGSDESINYMPGDNGDWTKWEAIVRDMAQAVVQNGYKTQYDIWNEPDSEWGVNVRSYNQYLEMWKRTVLLIRSIDHNAVIVGPSSAGYDFVQDTFLPYAKANNVLPDVLSWHHYKSVTGKSGSNPVSDLSKQVIDMRTYLNTNRIIISNISINEYQDKADVVNAGELVQYLYELEKAKVDSASRGCWPESQEMGGNVYWGCWKLNNFLNVVGTPEESGTAVWKPRSIWWAMKGYADITGRLVQLSPANNIHGVAGYDSVKKEARMVLGRTAGTGSADIQLNNLGSVFSGGTVHVEANRITASGFAPLAAPVKVIDKDYQVSNNSLRITLPNFSSADAYTIVLRAPTGMVVPPPPPSASTIEQPSTVNLAVGDRVVTTSSLNVRAEVFLTATIKRVVPTNTKGTIIRGPYKSDGHIWWEVQFEEVSGFVVQDWLAETE